ncbi:magnesium-translocating P-type ATPase [Mycoplasmopsis gallinarum]|uniref:magnesium-translocating P-type ATPase n=1 Tax=Mycoplasmopsis gallinarum TaxID=29557 RepID=UPI0004860A7A|nr:magnesium-translocating P-type ATPase [Mycoplasmopsis gallinarum]
MFKFVKKNNKNDLNNNEIKNKLKYFSDQKISTVFEELNSSDKGLKDSQIEINQKKYGSNKLIKKGKGNIWKLIWESFFNPFSIILIILAFISAITNIIIPLSKHQSIEYSDYATVIIITIMVLVSGILHIVNEIRSSASAEKLVKLVQTTTRVERDGIFYEIPLEEVVAGDIVILAAGDIIPADVRILSAKDLFVSQSSLTGESDAIEKHSRNQNRDADANITDASNLAFMGSNVISGSARAIVIMTGNKTYLGQIAQKISEKGPKTDFEKGIRIISLILISIMLIIAPFVFLIVGFKTNDWINALFFTISIAVGLTPEMLPMIVTSTLAKGALSMSKKQTIVKNLNSIQNFGAMDVFCTDKTGTLTMDQVVLEKHLDINGQENIKVLQYGFLNSFYQTGLKNLLDISIINRTEELSDKNPILQNLEKQYTKIDEIPFDFQRKRMSVLVKDKSEKIQLITKGAIEEMLSISKYIEIDNKIVEINEETTNKILKRVDKLNDSGMRVLGIARKNTENLAGNLSINDENEMILIGYLAFLDPPKESTASAIKKLHDLGVNVKILTGDNARVTKAICEKVGIKAEKILLGKDLLKMSDEELKAIAYDYDIYAKLSPDQKARIIEALKQNKHVVGYMGDGINDAPAMKVADVSISVDTAVDIAKETANIILLEKDLNVLATGIIEGRKTYTNMNKYIKMTISSNFGNILSILFATFAINWFPFLPMLPIQILFLNLIYDISCGAIPWDNVDDEFITKPRKWQPMSIVKFMLCFGPVSSIIDISFFLLMRFVFIPNVMHITNINSAEFAILFQTGWFILSIWTQALVVHFIRTKKIPFIQSKSSNMLILLGLSAISIITVSPLIPGLSSALKLQPLQPLFYLMLIGLVISYIVLVLLVKWIYVRKTKELL